MTAVFTVAGLLAATSAGRVGEDGSGAMWVAPELLGPLVPTQACDQRAMPRVADLVFEYVDDTTLEHEAVREVAAKTRKGAPFEWNPRTGELGLDGMPGTGVFGDVERAAAHHSSVIARSCGSN